MKQRLSIKHITLITLYIMCCSSCLMFQHKRFASKTAAEVSDQINELSSEEKIRQIAKSAIEGAFDGTASPSSDENIQKLSANISAHLEKELNKVFNNLDTKTPGKKFSEGVVENLINKEVEAKLKELLSSTVLQTEADLKRTISELERQLNTSIDGVMYNVNDDIASLDESFQKALSNNLQDSVSNFVNNALADIELNTLSHKMSTELLSRELRDSIISLASEVQKNIDITEPIPGILSLLRQNAIIFSIVGFFLIASLIYWSYYLRKRSILGDDLTEILHNLKETEDNELIGKLEDFLREKGHYEFYKKQLERLKRRR